MPSSLVRKGIWAAAAIAVAAFLILAALPFIASTQIVRDRIAIEMSAWSGYRVELGAGPDIEFWPFRAILDNVTLSGWSDPSRKPVIVAERVEVELSALAALRGDIVFSGARLIRPTLRLAPVRGKLLLPASPGGGRIARSVEIARAVVGANPAAPDVTALPRDPFGNVDFVDGRVIVARGDVDEEVVTGISGNVNWPALDRRGSLSATGIWRGESVAIDVSTPKPLILFAGGPAPLTLKLKAAPANLSFDGTANLSGDTFFDGPVTFSSPSLRRMLEWSTANTAPGPAIGALAVSGDVSGNAQRIKLADADVVLDENPGMGVLDVSFTDAVPTISGSLAFDALDLRSLLTAFTPLDPVNATVDEIDTAFADRFNLDLRLSATSANAGVIKLAEVAASAQIKPGLAAFDISDARAFGGTIQTSIRLDRQPGNNLVEARLLATDIDGAMLAAASQTASVVPSGRGTVSIILKGPGKSWGDLLKTGDGSITASFGQGTISNFSISAFLERLKKGDFFALSEVTKGTLPVTSVELKATIAKGMARIERAEAKAGPQTVTLAGVVPTIGGGLALSGTVATAAQDANMPPSLAGFFVGGSWLFPFIAPAHQGISIAE
ncbi:MULTISPECIES: AsmA family protein [unclassified Mesorhizobium]|uniref:AsmA family protein n=1 Tax=unclassified Mesorhizobium TaxID=325217 RepID=UPI0019263320|nr:MULTISPECIES: AsmA-like C-terminal region-containing protein [unclassified Mesorhizobium]